MSAPEGSDVHAKPRSIVIPRRRSSAQRSGSIPVSARTSVDFPWSTCPAVARTCMCSAAAGEHGGGQRGVGVRGQGAQVEQAAAVLDAAEYRWVAGAQGGGVALWERDRGAR